LNYEVQDGSEDFYEAWNEYTILCPNFELFDTLTFDKDPGAMISKRGEFSIHRCNPLKRNDCKDKSEIDEFIKDLIVEIWSLS